MSVIKFRPRGRRDEHYLSAIDMGGSKVSCLIARENKEGADFEVVGAGHHGMQLHGGAPTLEAVENGIRAAVDSAERLAANRIHSASIAINGRYLHSRRIGVDLEIAGGMITAEDVADSMREGARIAAADGFSCIHALPVTFRVDGEEIFADPTGLTGGFLTTEMLCISSRNSLLENYTNLLARCDLKVDQFIAGPLASADSVLVDDEKELGVIVLDFGANTTSYAVYENGMVIGAGGVPMGGGHITKDIAKIFGTPLGDAERIKTLYGSALSGPGDEHRFVDIPQFDVNAESVRVARTDIADVIAPRLEEIFDLIVAKLREERHAPIGLRRAVITGGGSLLVGALEECERKLRMRCRRGRPISVYGAPEALTGPGFATCSGAIRRWPQLNLHGGAHFRLDREGQSVYPNHSGLFGSAGAWLRARF